MNTKIKQSAWSGNILGIAVAFLTVALATTLLYSRVAAEPAHPAREPIPVSVTAFEMQRTYAREQRFLGAIKAGARSSIGFEVPGTIADVHVREGDRVAGGEALAMIDSNAMQARREATAATVAQIEAELELAQGRTERQAPLRESGAISEQTFDDTRLSGRALASRLAAVRADLRALDLDIEKATLRAPYPAIIGRQLLDSGAIASPGTAVFTLIETAQREAHIGVAVEQAARLIPGQHYAVSWRDQSIDVSLRSVRPDVNPTTMTVTAIFDLPEGVDAYDGEPVALTVPVVEQATGGWVPLSALLEGKRGVWTVLRLNEAQGGNTTVREVVEVLHVKGDLAFVKGTLKGGDQLIADGVHRIAPGTAVRAAEV